MKVTPAQIDWMRPSIMRRGTQASLQSYRAPLVRDARLWLYRQESDRLAIKRSGAVRLPVLDKALEQALQAGGPGRRAGD
jgi:hypothetical protein